MSRQIQRMRQLDADERSWDMYKGKMMNDFVREQRDMCTDKQAEVAVVWGCLWLSLAVCQVIGAVDYLRSHTAPMKMFEALNWGFKASPSYNLHRLVND